MHIPASMLHGAVCPVTLAVATAGVGAAASIAAKSEEKPSVWRFAAVTSLIFALQMLNFPVQNGTSGHLLGSVLAVSLLGVPFAVLSMSIVLAVQAVFFGDGGINALGANMLNMSLVGVGVAGLVLDYLSFRGGKTLSFMAASVLSVMAAAAVCSFEVASCGAVALSKVLPAMLSVHALIGIGEGLLTVAVAGIFSAYRGVVQANEKALGLGTLGLAALAAFISPLASGWPDGLEWVAGHMSFARFSGFNFPALFPDYQAVFLGDTAAATIAAGIAGVALVFGVAFMCGKFLDRKSLVTA